MSTDRPISAVLVDIVDNVRSIVRSEARLAKAEVTEELAELRSAGTLLVVGLIMVTLSLFFLLLGAVYALSLVVPGWAAALIVGASVGVFASLFCGIGIRKFKAVRAVPKTSATIKETVEWAKHPTR